MDSVLENNYIFEIDCLQTIKGLGQREVLISMKPSVVLLSAVFHLCYELLSCLFGDFNFDRGGQKM